MYSALEDHAYWTPLHDGMPQLDWFGTTVHPSAGELQGSQSYYPAVDQLRDAGHILGRFTVLCPADCGHVDLWYRQLAALHPDSDQTLFHSSMSHFVEVRSLQQSDVSWLAGALTDFFLHNRRLLRSVSENTDIYLPFSNPELVSRSHRKKSQLGGRSTQAPGGAASPALRASQ